MDAPKLVGQREARINSLNKATRIRQLEELLSTARHDYYVKSIPKIPDDVYDAWRDELAELCADSPEIAAVGAPSTSSEWKKVRHEIPMGSLEKVNEIEELKAWASKVSTTAYDEVYEELFVTEKLDGISIAVRYEDGAFTRGVTRGDGVEGEDITVNVARMKGIPARLPAKFTGEIRGEILCLLSDLATHFPDYANPRNTASGISSRLDGSGSEHLTVVFYNVSEGKDDLEKRSDQFAFLKQMGFTTPNCYVTSFDPIAETPHDLWLQYQQTKRATLDYAIDGLVVELNNVAHQLALGENNGRPHGARAFKFAAVSRESCLRSIENETAGTGRITPVAIFDEVNLLGTKVTRASLYNWKYIRELGLDVGAQILVARANDVIPRVVRVTAGTGTVAKPPQECSSCGSFVGFDGEYLVCENASECPAQALGRLVRYVKSLNILEWGEAVLERLVATGVTDVSHLYLLKQETLAGIDRMGAKSAKKLLENLHAKSPIPIESFFGALSIPGCGESIMTLVVDAGHDTVEKLLAVTYDQLTDIPGLGPVRARTLRDWLDNRRSWIEASGIPLKERIRGNLTGTSFCFTGKTVTKRATLEDMVRNAGGTVKGSVGKGLSYLVMSDPSSGSTKAQAAKKNGTETISEDAFLKMVGV